MVDFDLGVILCWKSLSYLNYSGILVLQDEIPIDDYLILFEDYWRKEGEGGLVAIYSSEKDYLQVYFVNLVIKKVVGTRYPFHEHLLKGTVVQIVAEDI